MDHERYSTHAGLSHSQLSQKDFKSIKSLRAETGGESVLSENLKKKKTVSETIVLRPNDFASLPSEERARLIRS